MQKETIDEIVNDQKALATKELLKILGEQGELKFSFVVASLLQAFMLRETNIKDICVELAKTGQIQNTWGGGNRKPHDEHIIGLKLASP